MSEYPQSETAMLLRIQQLEEALEHARWVIESYTAGQEKYLAPIDAALSASEVPPEEQQYPWWEDYGYVSSEAPEKEE